MATLATTGTTFTPAAFQSAMYLPGFPAPVVTAFTPSWATTRAMASASGFISMMFTPKGLSVMALHCRICSRTNCAGAAPAPMMPKPPASDTAAARRHSAIHAMPPWIRGYSVPRSSVILVFIPVPTFSPFLSNILSESPDRILRGFP